MSSEATAVPVHEIALLDGVGAWVTGRPPTSTGAANAARGVGRPGNLSHRRPHLPSRLASDRAAAAAQMGLAVEDVHLMRQVHGAAAAVVTDTTPRGAELRDVDALVTALPGRALAVQVADCVPLLLASTEGPVGVAHAGREGLAAGVVEAVVASLARVGAAASTLHAAIGPAIGGCCYEVPGPLRDRVAALHPVAVAETSWGTPSLDLPAAVAAVLTRLGVARVTTTGSCTRCDPAGRWFSHRADPDAGRQLGVVVRREDAA